MPPRIYHFRSDITTHILVGIWQKCRCGGGAAIAVGTRGGPCGASALASVPVVILRTGIGRPDDPPGRGHADRRRADQPRLDDSLDRGSREAQRRRGQGWSARRRRLTPQAGLLGLPEQQPSGLGPPAMHPRTAGTQIEGHGPRRHALEADQLAHPRHITVGAERLHTPQPSARARARAMRSW